MSIVNDTDSYKLSHPGQRDDDIANMMYYVEARYHDGSFNVGNGKQLPDYILWSGLQRILIDFFGDASLKESDIKKAHILFRKHGPTWQPSLWYNLLKKHKGKLPLIIKAAPEGSVIPLSNVLMTIETTDPEFNWLPGWLETKLMRLWYPSTVGTLSHLIKQDLKKYWEMTSDAPIESLNFKLHDFGSRGVSSEESAAIGGTAHLLNFMGTDTCVALENIYDYYNGDIMEFNCPGFSVDAAEHSTILPWGKENESKAYEHIIDLYGAGIVSIVADSYDHWNAVENIFGGSLKEKVKNAGGLIVIRPDSGDPASVVLKTILILMEKFGFETNSKGYAVLPDYIRVIQGDGINRKSIINILEALKLNNISIDNITFGMGGALLQKVNRDTFGFAMKPCAVQRDGTWEGVSKNPIDMANKKSKAGRLKLVNIHGEYQTISEEDDPENKYENELVTYYDSGLVDGYYETFEEIRARVS